MRKTNVVQTALELLQQDLTGDALLALSLLVVSMELLLEYAVDEFYLLLFCSAACRTRTACGGSAWADASWTWSNQVPQGKDQASCSA